MVTSTTPTEGLSPLPDRWDAWLLWPVGSMVLVWFVCAVLDQMPGLLSFCLIPISFLALLLAETVLLVVVCVFVSLRRIRKATSFALAFMFPFVLRAPVNRAADFTHLALTVEFGIGVLNGEQVRHGALIDSIRPPLLDTKFQVFDWSVGLAAGTSTFLIYDAIDEMALPLSQHKNPALDESGFGQLCTDGLTHLFRHYYLCNYN
jgi:hypothetical protein